MSTPTASLDPTNYAVEWAYVPDTQRWHSYVIIEGRAVIGARGASLRLSLASLAKQPAPLVLLPGEAEGLEAYHSVAQRMVDQAPTGETHGET